MPLKDYKGKRDPKSTAEPFSSSKNTKATKGTLLFVVQKHAASHLHYDFRLELDGVLKSWAVPKGPSMNPADKRLAIMVEDHPYDYHDFEGTIAPGNYGAGTVMVWDTGNYQPVDKESLQTTLKALHEGLNKGHLSFFLEGRKLRGRFSLVKLKNNPEENHWLLIKGSDEHATSKDVLKQDTSVLTHRSMDQISDSDTAWKSNTLSKKKALKPHKHDVMPTDIKPMLAHVAEEPFDNEQWLFETKWDGYRAIAEVKPGQVKLYSRNSQSFNERFAPITQALENLGMEAVLDGEILILDEQGRSNFQSLQNYQNTGKGDLRYVCFDLLYCSGYDLRSHPLEKRKQLLKALLPKGKKSLILYSPHIVGQGKKLFQEATKKNWEGIMAKEISSTYVSHRSRAWLKIKTHLRQEAIICGFTAPRGSRKKFGALILGIYKNSKLSYVGHVGGGFNEQSLTDIQRLLKPLINDKCPFTTRPITNTPVTWVSPQILCEVSFSEWTTDSHMRHPIFEGLRMDKKPQQVKKETALMTKTSPSTFTNLDKIYFPKDGYTKGDLLHYYEEIAPFLLPYLKNRPQTLHRFPNGIHAQGFYQKNIDENFPAWLPRHTVQHKDSEHIYLMIPDKKTLLYAANLGCIEFNPFNSRIQALENPDYMILDLDPEAIPFAAVIETALALHDLLDTYKIPHYCKTSGATGLHIYVPMGAKYTYEQVKLFAQIIVTIAHKKLPKITSLERSPAKRQKKVYLDYLQNNFGQTVASPYSVRPRDHAPVSTPLDWAEVKPGLEPTDFTIKNILQRLKKTGDLFKAVLKKGINLELALKNLSILPPDA